MQNTFTFIYLLQFNDNKQLHHKDSLQKSHRPHTKADHLKEKIYIYIYIYIITQVIHGFWLVLVYDLLEDRRTIDVTISFYANKV